MQLLYRLLIGGLVVSLFALAADLLQPTAWVVLAVAAGCWLVLGSTLWWLRQQHRVPRRLRSRGLHD